MVTDTGWRSRNGGVASQIWQERSEGYTLRTRKNGGCCCFFVFSLFRFLSLQLFHFSFLVMEGRTLRGWWQCFLHDDRRCDKSVAVILILASLVNAILHLKTTRFSSLITIRLRLIIDRQLRWYTFSFLSAFSSVIMFFFFCMFSFSFAMFPFR